MAYQAPQLVLVGAAAKIVLGSINAPVKYLDSLPVSGDIPGWSRHTPYQ